MANGIEVVPLAGLEACIGQEFGPTDWVALTQDRIDRFADLTLDRQFIHVDPVRAASTPFGGTVAHGFLTLSMLAYFQGQAGVMPEGTVLAVNYGLNKVRFLQPVKSGQRIRARMVARGFQHKSETQILATLEVSVEIEAEAKPALVAEGLTMFYLN